MSVICVTLKVNAYNQWIKIAADISSSPAAWYQDNEDSWKQFLLLY
jgi:hypothetical protein